MEPILMFKFSCLNCSEQKACFVSKECKNKCKVKEAIHTSKIFEPYVQLDQPGITRFFMDPIDSEYLSEMEKKLSEIKQTYTQKEEELFTIKYPYRR